MKKIQLLNSYDDWLINWRFAHLSGDLHHLLLIRLRLTAKDTLDCLQHDCGNKLFTHRIYENY
jgi:hypothetical protein